MLVVSAKEGEFILDDKTKEQLIFAYYNGKVRLIVVICNMDNGTVRWAQDQFNKIVKYISSILKKIG